MSDNDADVVLVTQDAQLQQLITHHRPPAAKLRCLAPADLKDSNPPRAEQWWVDLDSLGHPEIGDCRRRVYFYTRPPDEAHQLPPGLFVRKPCAPPAVALLWAEVTTATDEPGATPKQGDLRNPGLLPGWLLELHELDLRRLCHKCIKTLPARLGYAEIALYLYDAEQNLLTLAETNSKRYVDLAISLSPQNQHVLAVVARSAKPLITQDLAEACRSSGMRCPSDLERASSRAAAIAPLVAQGKLRGLLLLNDRCGSDLSEVGLPLDQIFAFLARCLQHARQYLRARVEARVDRLTGLFNYRRMIETLSKEIRRSQRYGNPLALIMVDLDGLKSVNDRFGHVAGDALLRHVARKISAALRQVDSAARIGGDEFSVLLPATDLEGARQVAQRILTAIRTDAPVISQKPLPIAVSVGVAQWEDGWDENRLIQAADEAMYTAKRQGHNRLVCHRHETEVKPPVATAAQRVKQPHISPAKHADKGHVAADL
jgi:diguanylate cyclase (GGDEF)-like protein